MSFPNTKTTSYATNPAYAKNIYQKWLNFQFSILQTVKLKAMILLANQNSDIA
tara:strand:- start:614 stop:772 length:159 start_codon:yes stop_codon:yes gene_type:complete